MTDAEALEIVDAVSRVGMAKGQLMIHADDDATRIDLATEYAEACSALRVLLDSLPAE